MPKIHGQKRVNTLRVYLYAQKTWAEKRKHPAGIPICPENMGRKEEM
jgi:hypothetical protein